MKKLFLLLITASLLSPHALAGDDGNQNGSNPPVNQETSNSSKIFMFKTVLGHMEESIVGLSNKLIGLGAGKINAKGKLVKIPRKNKKMSCGYIQAHNFSSFIMFSTAGEMLKELKEFEFGDEAQAYADEYLAINKAFWDALGTAEKKCRRPHKAIKLVNANISRVSRMNELVELLFGQTVIDDLAGDSDEQEQ